jgi:hypothetical protein
LKTEPVVSNIFQQVVRDIRQRGGGGYNIVQFTMQVIHNIELFVNVGRRCISGERFLIFYGNIIIVVIVVLVLIVTDTAMHPLVIWVKFGANVPLASEPVIAPLTWSVQLPVSLVQGTACCLSNSMPVDRFPKVNSSALSAWALMAFGVCLLRLTTLTLLGSLA